MFSKMLWFFILFGTFQASLSIDCPPSLSMKYEDNRPIISALLTRDRYIQHKTFNWSEEHEESGGETALKYDDTIGGVDVPLYDVQEMLIHFASRDGQNISAKVILTSTKSEYRTSQYLSINGVVKTEHHSNTTLTLLTSPNVEQFHRLYLGKVAIAHVVIVKPDKTAVSSCYVLPYVMSDYAIDRLLIHIDPKTTIVKKIVAKGYAEAPNSP